VTSSALQTTYSTQNGIPATGWDATNGVPINPLTLYTSGNSLVFAIQEVWSKEPSSPDPILKAELRTGSTLLATTSTRDSAGILTFPSIAASVLPVGIDNLFVRIYSKASTYTFTGVGYLDTPNQPITIASGSGGGGNGGGGGCFVPETYVLTVDGPKKIKDINIGDLIITLSENNFVHATGSLAPYRVSDKLVHNDREYATLNINGVLTTDEHLWATTGNTFDRADTISKIIAIDLSESKTLPVSIAAIKLTGPVVPEVLNLTVDEARTFLVAPSMFGPWSLVHNIKSKSIL
jgi:hypothetical protein